MILEGFWVDGRYFDEVRFIYCELYYLFVLYGLVFFLCGDMQVCVEILVVKDMCRELSFLLKEVLVVLKDKGLKYRVKFFNKYLMKNFL